MARAAPSTPLIAAAGGRVSPVRQVIIVSRFSSCIARVACAPKPSSIVQLSKVWMHTSNVPRWFSSMQPLTRSCPFQQVLMVLLVAVAGLCAAVMVINASQLHQVKTYELVQMGIGAEDENDMMMIQVDFC